MALAYSSTTSGEKAVKDMQKILQQFGCKRFGHMMDWEEGKLLVQFEYRGNNISVEASVDGYAAAWLKDNPWTNRKHCSKIEHERKAKDIGSVAVYSILRDWIKGQVTAIETGVLSFEGAFLGQILLPSGQTILNHVTTNKLLLEDK